MRLKNVGTGTFLAVSGGDLVLESTGSSEGLWTYTEDTTHSNNQVTLKNSASNKYLCTAEEPEIADTCSNSVVEWTISFVSNTVSLSLFTSATRTTTSVTITSVTEGRDKAFQIVQRTSNSSDRFTMNNTNMITHRGENYCDLRNCQ